MEKYDNILTLGSLHADTHWHQVACLGITMDSAMYIEPDLDNYFNAINSNMSILYRLSYAAGYYDEHASHFSNMRVQR